MKRIKDILGDKFTIAEFWAVVDALPDDVDGKNPKVNIHSYFKKNGDPKAKALSLSTDEDFQTWHDTHGFIHKQVRQQIHMNKLRKRADESKQHAKDKKEKKDKSEQIEEKINPVVLRHQLVVEYNRLIREGNPDTKELREQINVEIQKIESETESESDVTS